MSSKRLRLFILLCITCTFITASHAGATWQADPNLVRENSRRHRDFLYDESRVPPYTLPDPLTLADGTTVTNAQTWQTRRRPEILELFRTHVYGRAPIDRPPYFICETFEQDPNALAGLATRKQVTIRFADNPGRPALDILIYRPNHVQTPIPTFLLLNFFGNHTIHSDPAIKLSTAWIPANGQGVVDNHATELSRGSAASRFPLETILQRGYALTTCYYGDIDPDFHDGFKNGVHPLFDPHPPYQRYSDSWGAIAAWAWGLSRILDYLGTDPAIDASRVAVLGHSRLGKAALWAGATDQRFALVISNQSGCGGAALSRRAYGETIRSINTRFPHWFCRNFTQYNDNESALPLDQHMLLALIAPRPLYVASADGDLWSDPRGEFLACLHAEPVYRLFNLPGLPTDQMPPIDTPLLTGQIAYHIRSGPHELTAYDWAQYLDFADRHLR